MLPFLSVALVVVAAATAGAVALALPAFLGYLVGVNVATMAIYGYDKAVAGGTRMRVPERVLHLLALMGGSPAALLSQNLFRHKTVKTSFQRVFWLIVALQTVALAAGVWWWFHPPAWLRPS